MEANFMKLILSFLLLLILVTVAGAAPKTLDVYFIDVEGGAATLIVTPQGESMLIDAGFPGERDSARIAHVARDVAGLKEIDHFIATHWHRDHFGGIPALIKLIPIKQFYDHGFPATPAPDMQPELLAAYRAVVSQSVTLKAGDNIKVRPAVKNLPPFQVRVVASSGLVIGEKPGAAAIQPCGPNFQSQPEDKTDNYNSLGFLLSYGSFQLFNGGDLSWNIEGRLACPKNIPGVVDVYEVDHHGADSSNNPALVQALKPRVAIIGNGPRKGGEVKTFATLKSTPEIEAIYQLHRNVATTDNDNTTSDYIANEAEQCQGEYIKLEVAADGKSYTVSIPSKKISRTYKTK